MTWECYDEVTKLDFSVASTFINTKCEIIMYGSASLFVLSYLSLFRGYIVMYVH